MNIYNTKNLTLSVKCTEMVLLCTHDKQYRVSPVGFMLIAFFDTANRCPKTNTHCHNWWSSCRNAMVLKHTFQWNTDNSRECTYRCGNLTFFSAIWLVSNQNNPFSSQISSTPCLGLFSAYPSVGVPCLGDNNFEYIRRMEWIGELAVDTSFMNWSESGIQAL